MSAEISRSRSTFQLGNHCEEWSVQYFDHTGPWPRCFSQYHRACHATPLDAVFFHFNGDDRDGLSSGILLDCVGPVVSGSIQVGDTRAPLDESSILLRVTLLHLVHAEFQ